MNLSTHSQVLLPIQSLPSWPAVLLASPSCQNHLPEMVNLIRDSSPKAVIASAKNYCWYQDSQGNRALMGLKETKQILVRRQAKTSCTHTQDQWQRSRNPLM